MNLQQTQGIEQEQHSFHSSQSFLHISHVPNVTGNNHEANELMIATSDLIDENSEIENLTKRLDCISIQDESLEITNGNLHIISTYQPSNALRAQSKRYQQQKPGNSQNANLTLYQTQLHLIMNWLKRIVSSNKMEVKKSCLLRRQRPIHKVSKILCLFKLKNIVYVIVKLEKNQERNILFSLKEAKQYFPIHLQGFLNNCASMCQRKLQEKPDQYKQMDFLNDLFGGKWILCKKTLPIQSGSTQVIFVGMKGQNTIDLSNLIEIVGPQQDGMLWQK